MPYDVPRQLDISLNNKPLMSLEVAGEPKTLSLNLPVDSVQQENIFGFHVPAFDNKPLFHIVKYDRQMGIGVKWIKLVSDSSCTQK